MADEIERKFRLISDAWRDLSIKSQKIRQGYLQSGLKAEQASSIRVRIADDDGQKSATINIKTASMSIHRSEYEYKIPVDDAEEMLVGLCEGSVIEKTRFIVPHAAHRWEIDIFEGINAGLEIAEVELKSIDEDVKIPDWIGEEVSDNPMFYNNYLLVKPYKSWP